MRIWTLDRRYNRVTIRLGGHDAEEKVERTSRQPLYEAAAEPRDGLGGGPAERTETAQ